MVRLKKNIPKAPSIDSQLNSFINYLNAISANKSTSAQLEFGKLKLDIAKEASQRIKQSQDAQLAITSKDLASSTMEQQLAPPLAALGKLANTTGKSAAGQPKLKLFLHEMLEGRKKNELIYGYRDVTFDGKSDKGFGMEAAQDATHYKRSFESTVTREQEQWADFAISYDNKIFLNYPISDKNYRYQFDHLTMGFGTFLKAAGKIKIEKQGNVIIAPYSEYLELGPHYLPIILFVLKEKEILDAVDVFIADEGGKLTHYVQTSHPVSKLCEELKLPAYIWDEERFASAKAIAENETFSITEKLAELFLRIDDEIFSSRKLLLINAVETKRFALKADIINFLLLMLKINLQPKKQDLDNKQADDLATNTHEQGESSKTKNIEEKHRNPSTETLLKVSETQEKSTGVEQNIAATDSCSEVPQTQEVTDKNILAKKAEDSSFSKETVYQLYNKIFNTTKEIKNHYKIDLNFLHDELFALFCYFFNLQFQTEDEADQEKKALDKINEIETALQNITKDFTIMPQRDVWADGRTEAYFMRFYTENPVYTCIALLRDYTKGSFFRRLFSGAWGRHHIRAVAGFLDKYDTQQVAHDISITSIYRKIFAVEHGLEAHSGKKGTLVTRLLFCARLANELSRKDSSNSATAEDSSRTQQQTTRNLDKPIGESTQVNSPSASSVAGDTLIEKTAEPELMMVPLGNPPVMGRKKSVSFFGGNNPASSPDEESVKEFNDKNPSSSIYDIPGM
jgi:hypothetical protein